MWADTESHYNKHARKPVDTTERRKGAAFPLKQFHNQIKKDMISAFARLLQAETLLDLCCGRGGDIHKWLAVPSLRYVKGIDIADVELKEARERFTNITKGSK
eukprot:TRINITY_DN12244_c0_g1_i3.p1 TRINITY_DN12244_c0_g1~~TRINITY_DN12244_c0_g1_i3.p1  ORF type:complete len:103 (+),score=20.09 TRINITY_DN12244_c0_g1_i3:129-437(+)